MVESKTNVYMKLVEYILEPLGLRGEFFFVSRPTIQHHRTSVCVGLLNTVMLGYCAFHNTPYAYGHVQYKCTVQHYAQFNRLLGKPSQNGA